MSFTDRLLGPEDLGAVAALCARAVADPIPLTVEELHDAFFAPDQPAVVRGDPDIGVVATVHGDAGGFIRLLVLDPAKRGRGLGHELLAAAEADLAGEQMITVGADAPYYLWPGVPVTATGFLALLERHRYDRAEANYNVDVDLSDLPPDPDGPVVATEADAEEVDAFMRSTWVNWRAEVMRALHKGTLAISRDDDGICAFCAWDVNRRGLLGPVAVRPGFVGRGIGMPVMIRALHRMRESGLEKIEVSWVGPFVPYARVGGTVGRVFFVYRKRFKR